MHIIVWLCAGGRCYTGGWQEGGSSPVFSEALHAGEFFFYRISLCSLKDAVLRLKRIETLNH